MGVLDVLLLPGGGHLRGLIGMESLQPLTFLSSASLTVATDGSGYSVNQARLYWLSGMSLGNRHLSRDMFREPLCDHNMFS